MAGTYFLGMVLGVPLVIFVLSLLAGYLHRDSDAEVLDWKPTRSSATEIKLERGEIDQMLAAQNELRRRRGAPERSLEQVTEHLWKT